MELLPGRLCLHLPAVYQSGSTPGIVEIDECIATVSFNGIEYT